MKKILFFLFFLLFTVLLFIWDEGMTTFWKDGEHFSFLGQGFLSWTEQYGYVYDSIIAYKDWILLFSVGWLLVTIPLYIYGKRKEVKKISSNPLYHGTSIIDGNSILSAGSLPESEKKREKEKKVWPFMSKDVNVNKEVKIPKDVDLDTMKTLLKKTK